MHYDQLIEGRTVRLRAVEESDARVTWEMRRDPEKSRYIHAAPGTVDDQLDFIRTQRERDGDWLFLVEDLQGRPIGMKGVYNYDPKEKTAETGRFMNFGSQLQGIEALCLSFDFAFDVLGVETIVMSALEDNTNMRGIQDKFGVKVVHREYNPEFGCDSVYSVLTKNAFAVSRKRVTALIDRFATRQGRLELR